MTDWHRLHPGAAITRWAMSAAQTRHYPGAARPMPDRVAYRFVNGWVQTGDLPCREALRGELPGRVVPCPAGPFDDLALALDGPDLDFSRFCHLPTLIARGFRCRIRGTGPARFRVATCGGVRLWLDGQAAGVFEPFTRNRPAHGAFSLELTGGPQDLVLRLEDLHERDTTCFFALVLEAGQGVAVALPEGQDSAAVERAAKVLGGLRTDRVAYGAGAALRLVADVPPETPLRLRVADLGPFGRGGMVAEPGAANTVEAVLTPERPEAVLAEADALPPGCLSLRVETRVGGARLERQLGTTVLRDGVPLTGDWPERQAQVRRRVAAAGGFEPSAALCMAAEGRAPELVARIVAAGLDTIEARFDCSDFTILPLLRLYRDHRQGLPEALQARMKTAFLTYRYWLDEPGNDVMWFWSENHVLCFHSAQLVAGQLFPDEVFPASGRSGAEQATLAEARLDRWFAAIAEDGLCEWNSAAYYPIDMLGLLTLHDMAPRFRDRAAKVLDRVLTMAALHTMGGVPAGSQGRCYEKELLAGPHTELGSVMAMALGGGFSPGYDRAAGLWALSAYRPPEGLAALAGPGAGQSLRAAYVQGHGAGGRLSLWKSDAAQLSTVRPHAPGSHGHQAQVLDVQLACHPLARLWINHPGEARVWGERRPSLLAGSHVMPAVAQDGPHALMVFDLRRDWTELRYSQLFAAREAFGAPAPVGGWLVFAGTVAVWCSTPVEVETAGLYRGALYRAAGETMGWCLVLRLPGENAQGFARRLAGLAPEFAAGRVELVTHEGTHLSLTAEGVFTRDGKEAPFAPLSVTPHLGWNGAPLAPWTGG
ncbi:MAG: hypothetical protein EP318_04295 [Rhodobacteraceae bacterium]|nr:MAG: hypothetical protein EP318_04295 [Paracoccaceae bacterium]